MNAISTLEALGLGLGLSPDGNLIVDGLKHLDRERRASAVALAKEHKPAILAELRRRASAPAAAAELAHARRMLVACPIQKRKLHCWRCAHCEKARLCAAWRSRRADVLFFRQSEKPHSFYLAEKLIAEERQRIGKAEKSKSVYSDADVPF